MIDLDIETLSDIEIAKATERAAYAERLVVSEEWKLLREAANRIVDRAVNEFAIKTKPTDVERILELKITIKKFKFDLFSELEALAKIGPFLYEEAKRRDLELMEQHG